MVIERIVDGPSKFDLMVSLLQGHGDHRQAVTFKLESSGEVNGVALRINSLEREDGSGDCWNFTGQITSWGHRIGIYRKLNSHSAKGFFSTRTRTGTINIDW